jgi:hypothetical protein
MATKAIVTLVVALCLAPALATDVQWHAEASPLQNRKLQQWQFSEVWSDYLGSSTGVALDRAECSHGSFISTVRLSLNRYTAGGADTVAIGSIQGYCDDGVQLSKFPPNSPNDVYFIVKQEGFREFVGGASEVMQSFMFIGQSPDKGTFNLSCPDNLKLSGYQVKASSVIHAIKLKCSKI